MVKRWIAVGVALLACLVVVGCGIPQGDYDAVVAEAEAAKTQAASLQTQLDGAKSDLTEAESDLSAARSELADAESQISSLNSKVSSLQSEVSSLKSDLADAESQISSLQSEVSSLKSNLAAVQSIFLAASLSFAPTEYVNEEYGFSVKYPSSWEEITPQHETTVFQAAIPPRNAPGVSINVADIVEGVSFIDVYIAGLEEIGGTDIEVISESETILADGTPASIVILQYTSGDHVRDGFVVVVEKDGKYIAVSVYTANQYAPFSEEQMSEVAHTLRFE